MRTPVSVERSKSRKALGTRLRQIRNHFGWSQLVCSVAMGVAFATYRSYEAGERSPTACSLEQFHTAMNSDFSLHWLVTGTGESGLTINE